MSNVIALPLHFNQPCHNDVLADAPLRVQHCLSSAWQRLLGYQSQIAKFFSI
jgi:hypothetical protein